MFDISTFFMINLLPLLFFFLNSPLSPCDESVIIELTYLYEKSALPLLQFLPPLKIMLQAHVNLPLPGDYVSSPNGLIFHIIHRH